LKPGGSLLLKEHDVCDAPTYNLVLLEHALHDHRRGGLGLERLIEAPVCLRSKAEWDATLKVLGLVEYHSSSAASPQVGWGLQSEGGKSSVDPTRCFFARWIKPLR